MVQRWLEAIVVIEEEINLVKFRNVDLARVDRGTSKEVLDLSPVVGEFPESAFANESTQKQGSCNNSDSIVNLKILQCRHSVDGFKSKVTRKESATILPSGNLIIDLLDLSLLGLVYQGGVCVHSLVASLQFEKHFPVAKV